MSDANNNNQNRTVPVGTTYYPQSEAELYALLRVCKPWDVVVVPKGLVQRAEQLRLPGIDVRQGA
jgi:hypothetical protein